MLEAGHIANGQDKPETFGAEPDKGRVAVDLQCEIRIGNRAWRKAEIADLTPDGFQVKIFDMPPRGTQIYLRFANLQLLQAEVCWAKAETAGCRFINPIRDYIFEHIVANAQR